MILEEFKIGLLQEFNAHTWKHRYKCGLTAEQMRFIDFIILETLYDNDLLCEVDKREFKKVSKSYLEKYNKSYLEQLKGQK